MNFTNFLHAKSSSDLRETSKNEDVKAGWLVLVAALTICRGDFFPLFYSQRFSPVFPHDPPMIVGGCFCLFLPWDARCKAGIII